MALIGQTNYEINQQGYVHVPALSEEELNPLFANIGAWFSFVSDIEYVGLLCRDRNDYTVIHINNYNYTAAIQEIREVLESRGEIVDIRYDHKEKYYQCWVRERRTESIEDLESDTGFQWTPQVWMFALFNANEWVIEAGKNDSE